MARVDALKALGIERVEVDRASQLAHLEGFIESFVLPEYRDRISGKVRRSMWVYASPEIEKRLDSRRCRFWEEHSRPESYPPEYLARGIYIASAESGLEMSIADASRLSVSRSQNAIFSIIAGKLAIFLNHEWGVWYCKAPSKRLQ